MLALGEDPCTRLFTMMHEDEIGHLVRHGAARAVGGSGGAVVQ